MARQRKLNIIWTFALSSEQVDKARQFCGKDYRLETWGENTVPTLEEFEKTSPCLALFSPAGLRFMLSLPKSRVRHLELMPKVMMLGEDYSQADLEYAIDNNIAEIIRPPCSKKFFLEKLTRAQEMESVHHDLLRMSREIVLEREILERKNDILNFLVNFLTDTSASLEPECILQTAFTRLQMLFPVRSLHAAVWNQGRKKGQVMLYISAPDGSPAMQAWRERLLEQSRLANPDLPDTITVCPIRLDNQEETWLEAVPENGHMLQMPVQLADEQLGLLLLLTDMERSLGRDQAVALNSALQHLALSLKNALSFQTVKEYADYDVLTGVHSRRHFERRIAEELERSRRYHQSLSVIMVDLDNFKKINDSMGHRAGDQILAQTGSLLRSTLRSCDYAARYGGEEFVILLPHTTTEQARILAERLRLNIESHLFITEAGDQKITISQGIAGTGDNDAKKATDIIEEADNALYTAKNSGRNCVKSNGACTDGSKIAV